MMEDHFHKDVAALAKINVLLNKISTDLANSLYDQGIFQGEGNI